jgi:thioredoxin 2
VGPVELTDADFGSFINAGSLPVMVDFYSPTCGPCQMLNPVVTRLAAKFSGTLQVAKIDTGRNPLTANHYQIRGVPTLLFFSHGKVIEQLVGAMPEGELTQRIQQLIRT